MCPLPRILSGDKPVRALFKMKTFICNINLLNPFCQKKAGLINYQFLIKFPNSFTITGNNNNIFVYPFMIWYYVPSWNIKISLQPWFWYSTTNTCVPSWRRSRTCSPRQWETNTKMSWLNSGLFSHRLDTISCSTVRGGHSNSWTVYSQWQKTKDQI